MSQVDLLYRLQQAEDGIREDKKRLAEVIRLQSESAGLIKARQRAEISQEELTRLRVVQTDLGLELDGLTEKSRREEKRLYSGLVTNPKELEDLQHEIESLSRRISVLEDKFLEAMIEVEAAEDENTAAVENLNHIELEWRETTERCKDEQVELIERISELGEQKRQLESMVHPESMIAYEAARRRAGEVAVAALKDGRCRGCLVGVSAHQRKAVDEGQMVTCDNCGRILCPV